MNIKTFSIFTLAVASLFVLSFNTANAVGFLTVFANDDSGGQTASTQMGGQSTMTSPSVMSIAADLATFEITNLDQGQIDNDWLCRSVSGSAPNFNNCTWSKPFSTFWNQNIAADNTRYGITTSLSGCQGNCHYQSASINIDTLPPSTITVIEQSVTGGSWTVNPGSRSGSPITVRPSPSGTNYLIAVNTFPSGCTSYSVLNSDGGTDSVVVSPGQSKSFTITYTCEPAPPSVDIVVNGLGSGVKGGSTTINSEQTVNVRRSPEPPARCSPCPPPTSLASGR
jgi:hypothetical protein